MAPPFLRRNRFLKFSLETYSEPATPLSVTQSNRDAASVRGRGQQLGLCDFERQTESGRPRLKTRNLRGNVFCHFKSLSTFRISWRRPPASSIFVTSRSSAPFFAYPLEATFLSRYCYGEQVVWLRSLSAGHAEPVPAEPALPRPRKLRRERPG